MTTPEASTPYPISEPPKDPAAITKVDNTLQFPTFTSSTAWTLGCLLRAHLLTHTNPAVISISLANANQLLFHSTTHGGVVPDNDIWVSRKRATVLRWGVSTWAMHNRFKGDEAEFARKFGLGDKAGLYAIHGGGWPVRVKGVEGIVAVVVVSGLKQDQDHQIIVQSVEEFLAGQEGFEMEKKKED